MPGRNPPGLPGAPAKPRGVRGRSRTPSAADQRVAALPVPPTPSPSSLFLQHESKPKSEAPGGCPRTATSAARGPRPVRQRPRTTAARPAAPRGAAGAGVAGRRRPARPSPASPGPGWSVPSAGEPGRGAAGTCSSGRGAGRVACAAARCSAVSEGASCPGVGPLCPHARRWRRPAIGGARAHVERSRWSKCSSESSRYSAGVLYFGELVLLFSKTN